MSEVNNVHDLGAEVSTAEAALFEERADEIVAEVAAIAAEATAQATINAAGYRVVDLRGKFTSVNGSWGTSTKNLGSTLR